MAHKSSYAIDKVAMPVQGRAWLVLGYHPAIGKAVVNALKFVNAPRFRCMPSNAFYPHHAAFKICVSWRSRSPSFLSISHKFKQSSVKIGRRWSQWWPLFFVHVYRVHTMISASQLLRAMQMSGMFFHRGTKTWFYEKKKMKLEETRFF